MKIDLKTKFEININDVKLYITKIEVDQEDINISYNFNSYHALNTQKYIRMLARASNQDYMKISNWFDVNNIKKFNYKYNGIELIGIYPIDYDFLSHEIVITLNVDYISGDLKLFKLKELRKEKLKKICQKSS
jgi:hypothetical protein